MSKSSLTVSWKEMDSSNSLNISDLNFNNEHITTKSSFCDANNINHCIAYLCQELQALGFSPLYENDSIQCDSIKLINAAYSLLKLHSKTIKDREEFQERFNRLHCDYDLALKEINRFRDRLENNERNMQTVKETNRQLSVKTRMLQGDLKTEKDETKRLHGIVQQRDSQFHNELRRKEREIEMLKERLLQALSDKGAERRLGISISNNLSRQDGKRGKWQTKALSSQNEDDLQKQIVLSYDKRNKLLIEENILLRNSFQKLYKYLVEIEHFKSDSDQFEMKNDSILNVGKASLDSPELPNNYLIDSESKWFALPYIQVVNKIELAFEEKSKLIKKRLMFLETKIENETSDHNGSAIKLKTDELRKVDEKLQLQSKLNTQMFLDERRSQNLENVTFLEDREDFTKKIEFLEMKKSLLKGKQVLLDDASRITKDRESFLKEEIKFSEWKTNQESTESPPFYLRENIAQEYFSSKRVPSSRSDSNESPSVGVDVDRLLVEFERLTEDDEILS